MTLWLLLALFMWPVTALAGSVTVAWTAPTIGGSPSKYRLQRKAEACTGTGVWSALTTVSAPTRTYLDTAATDGSTYAYRVAAANTTGVGGWSGCSQILVGAPLVVPGIPGTPTLQLGSTPSIGPLVGMFFLDTSRFAEAKAKGITVGHVWADGGAGTTSYLDAAQALGMKVYVETAYLQSGGAQSLADLTARVTPIKDHPALLTLALTDEADLRGTPVATLVTAYQHLKSIAPTVPVSMVLTCEPTAPTGSAQVHCSQYVNAADWFYTDKYPVNYGSPPGPFVASSVNAMRAATTKIVNVVVQGFDWKNAFGPPPGSSTTRVPTPAETQEMGLAGLNASGNANLVFIYAWRENTYHPGQTFDQFNAAAWTGLNNITAAWAAWRPATRATSRLALPVLPNRTKTMRP